MAWRVTADPHRPDDALTWFRGRLPVTDTQLARLDARARERAWTIAGVAQLSVVQQAWQSIDSAIEKGISFSEWKKGIQDELTAAWGKPRSHQLETVFRNAVQTSYNAGRWRQMHDPEVLAFRPYGMVDAVLDSVTTQYCRDVDGTTLPLEHEWWRTHWFPAHHRCRTSVRSLRESEARRRGIAETPPDLAPQAGFGKAPTEGDWEPLPEKYAPRLWQAHRRRYNRKLGGPLKEGTHFKQLERGEITNAELSRALGAARKARLVEFLERQPLEKLAFAPSVARNANGAYWPSLRQLGVRTRRPKVTYGSPFEPGKVWSVSQAGKDRIDAIRRTFVHELGHHVHFSAGTDIDRRIREAFLDPDSKPLTQYAGANRREYWAESFAAWVFHRGELRRRDPVGYRMVREVLASQGIPL